MSARWRRAIFSNPIRTTHQRRAHGVAARLPHRARRRCATTGEAEERVEDEVRRADPFSVNCYLCTINRKLRETLRIVKKKDRDGELLC